ncbi:MAG: hypothetical protein ACPGWR_33010 [Ardenticatenaceae bacterium]
MTKNGTRARKRLQKYHPASATPYYRTKQAKRPIRGTATRS